MHKNTEREFMDAVRAAEDGGKRLTLPDVGWGLVCFAIGSMATIAAILASLTWGV